MEVEAWLGFGSDEAKLRGENPVQFLIPILTGVCQAVERHDEVQYKQFVEVLGCLVFVWSDLLAVLSDYFDYFYFVCRVNVIW